MRKLPLRPNVCILVFNTKLKLFLGERAGEKGVWQFPQGGVEEGLSTRENVYKELEEELGADRGRFKIIKKLKARHSYEFRRVPPYARGKWRGQRQSFWLVEFIGSDTDIDLARYEPEFSNWRWCTVKQVRRVAEPIRLPGYEPALKEFEKFARNKR